MTALSGSCMRIVQIDEWNYRDRRDRRARDAGRGDPMARPQACAESGTMVGQTMSAIGIINPGAMGISIAASARAAGHQVYWASAGRSPATRQRAEEHQLLEVESLTQLCAQCEIVICVCPPHAAESVAQSALAAGFRGTYCDGNAISPQKAQAIAARMSGRRHRLC